MLALFSIMHTFSSILCSI